MIVYVPAALAGNEKEPCTQRVLPVPVVPVVMACQCRVWQDGRCLAAGATPRPSLLLTCGTGDPLGVAGPSLYTVAPVGSMTITSRDSSSSPSVTNQSPACRRASERLMDGCMDGWMNRREEQSTGSAYVGEERAGGSKWGNDELGPCNATRSGDAMPVQRMTTTHPAPSPPRGPCPHPRRRRSSRPPSW